MARRVVLLLIMLLSFLLLQVALVESTLRAVKFSQVVVCAVPHASGQHKGATFSSGFQMLVFACKGSEGAFVEGKGKGKGEAARFGQNGCSNLLDALPMLRVGERAVYGKDHRGFQQHGGPDDGPVPVCGNQKPVGFWVRLILAHVPAPRLDEAGTGYDEPPSVIIDGFSGCVAR
jgi:hypothetical protein